MVDVRSWARHVWPEHPWERASVAHGAFHEVAVLDTVVARVAAGGAARQRTSREAATLRTVPRLRLPCSVPRLVGDPVHRDETSGVLCTAVPGRAHPDAGWDDVRDGLAGLLAALRVARSTDGLPADLPPVRAWCGGAGWARVVEDQLAPLLRARAARTAVEVVGRVLSAEAGVGTTFVHGDLNLHNVLWSDGRPTGLIDLDHAAWADPAVDVAPLVGRFGAARVAEIVDHDGVLERAMHHRASLPLQVAAAAQQIGNDRLRDHALKNFVDRAELGALHSPDGRKPPA